MKHDIGFLLRQARLNKNYSQEGICKGICAPSYLCKIEQGKAIPSQEILKQLFLVLDIHYCIDQKLLDDCKYFFELFFSRIEVEDSYEECTTFFNLYEQEIKVSEVHLEYHLYLCYMYYMNENEKAYQEKEYLESFLPYMDDDLKAKYYLICAFLVGKNSHAITYIEKAIQCSATSFSYYHLANNQFHLGNYEECMVNAERAYRIATEDGNPFVLISASFLLGSCHCFYHNHHTAEMFYKRAIALSRGYRISVTDYANYNLATSYLETGNYTEALYYFDKVEKLDEDEVHPFFYHQKRFVLYLKTKDEELAKQELEKMKEIAYKISKEEITLILEYLRLMLKENYLDDTKYEEILILLYTKVEPIYGHGLKRFYGIQLMELYKYQRKYKEALKIREEINIS